MSATTTTLPLRIALVDEHDLSVAGLTSLLAPFAERVELLDLRAALARAKDLDVVLYEPLGQAAFGEAMLRDLQQAGDAVSVVWSWAPAEQLPTATARPYLSKLLTASQLVRSLEDLLEGRGEHETTPGRDEPGEGEDQGEDTPAEPVEEPRPMRASSPVAPVTPSGMRLTRREHEILVLITNGLTNAEIGEQLTLSINSIKTYIRQAYRKIDVERRAQAVAWGMTNGLGGQMPEDLEGEQVDDAEEADRASAAEQLAAVPAAS